MAGSESVKNQEATPKIVADEPVGDVVAADLRQRQHQVLGADEAGGEMTRPLTSAGFTVQSRTNLVFGNWVNVPSPSPQIIGGQ